MPLAYYVAKDRLHWFIQRRKSDLIIASFWLADRLPWFARKPVVNGLAGHEVYSDFVLADQKLRGVSITEGFAPCVKW